MRRLHPPATAEFGRLRNDFVRRPEGNADPCHGQRLHFLRTQAGVPPLRVVESAAVTIQAQNYPPEVIKRTGYQLPKFMSTGAVDALVLMGQFSDGNPEVLLRTRTPVFLLDSFQPHPGVGVPHQ